MCDPQERQLKKTINSLDNTQTNSNLFNNDTDNSSCVPSNICVICENVSQGIHFGVSVCRACAAFFRRSTISPRKYVCRFNEKCKIGKNYRCSCRACRLKKCIDLGMNSKGVQRLRDNFELRQHLAPNDSSTTNFSNSLSFGMESNNEKQQNTVLLDNDNFTPIKTAQGTEDSNNQSNFFPVSSPTMPSTSKLSLAFTESNLSNTNYTTIQDKHDPTVSYTVLSKLKTPLTTNNLTVLNESNTSDFLSTNSTINKKNNEQILCVSSNSNFLNSPSTSVISSNINFGYCNTPSPSSAFVDVSSNLSQFSTLIKQSSTILNRFVSEEEYLHLNTPLINEMQNGCKKFWSLQKMAGSLNQNENIYQLLSENCELKIGTYSDDLIALKSDVSLVSELINNHFPPLSTFSTKSKWNLFRNFFCPLILIDRAYRTAKLFPNKDDTRFIISPHYYMDVTSLIHFFNVEMCKIDPAKMANVFEPTFRNAIYNIANPFRDLQVMEDELVGLIGILFWNHRLDEFKPSEVKIIEQTQCSLYNELYTVCRKNIANVGDYGVRFGKLCNTICHIYKIASELASNFSFLKMSSSFDVDTFFYKFIPQTW